MASYLRCYLGRIRRFQLRARLGSPQHFSIPCHLKPYVRFSPAKAGLSCSLRNKAYTPIGLELLSDKDNVNIFPTPPLPTESVFALLYIFRLSSCRFTEAFIILPCLPSVERFKIQQSPFAPVRLCCPYPPHYYGLIRHPLVCQHTSSIDLQRLPSLLMFP